ncbi:MAG: LemA family protein [Propionibacteriaceae bacterium]|jgi:hypothetical protein|nr:LemA family protein [Propionibacteriaceae bacterium]
MGWVLIGAGAFLVVAGLIAAVLISQYNSLLHLRQVIQDDWTALDAALARRHALIAPLAQVVATYSRQERAALEDLAVTRDAAARQRGLDLVLQRASSEESLEKGLRRIETLGGSVFGLASDPAYQALLRDLADADEAAGEAAEAYNSAVDDYLDRAERGAPKLVARWAHLSTPVYFEVGARGPSRSVTPGASAPEGAVTRGSDSAVTRGADGAVARPRDPELTTVLPRGALAPTAAAPTPPRPAADPEMTRLLSRPGLAGATALAPPSARFPQAPADGPGTPQGAWPDDTRPTFVPSFAAYSQPSGTSAHPGSSYGQAGSGYGQPGAGYGQPGSGYGQPSSAYAATYPITPSARSAGAPGSGRAPRPPEPTLRSDDLETRLLGHLGAGRWSPSADMPNLPPTTPPSRSAAGQPLFRDPSPGPGPLPRRFDPAATDPGRTQYLPRPTIPPRPSFADARPSLTPPPAPATQTTGSGTVATAFGTSTTGSAGQGPGPGTQARGSGTVDTERALRATVTGPDTVADPPTQPLIAQDTPIGVLNFLRSGAAHRRPDPPRDQ